MVTGCLGKDGPLKSEGEWQMKGKNAEEGARQWRGQGNRSAQAAG